MHCDREKKDTFEHYYNIYYRQALGYIFRRVNNISTAEDLAMDAFLACYQKFDGFDPAKASFATWLYVIINNRLKNFYRDRKDEEELDENIPDEMNHQNEMEEAVYLTWLRKHLAAALEELSENYRRIVIYKCFYDKSSAEIAELTGTTPGNVRVQYTRALQKLREYFKTNHIGRE